MKENTDIETCTLRRLSCHVFLSARILQRGKGLVDYQGGGGGGGGGGAVGVKTCVTNVSEP